MVHWQIKDFGKQSSITGRGFEEGAKVVSILLKDMVENELLRIDMLESEFEDWQPDGSAVILGRWSRLFSVEEKVLSKEERKDSAESFFISLYEADTGFASVEEVRLLRYLFAISLERNRILRSIPINSGASEQTFFHLKTKRNFEVPIEIPSRDAVSKIETIIGDLLL